MVQTSYLLVMIGGCVEFRSLEAALAATVPLCAVLGSLMGATLSLGYKFALVFLVFLGLPVACCAWCFPYRIASAVEDMHGNTGVSSTPSNEDSNKVETEPLLKV